MTRGQRCVFVGYSGDVEGGYIVIDLDRRTLYAGPDVAVHQDIGGARDLVTAIRADPFRVAEYASWVWKLWKYEPRCVLKKPGTFVREGVIIDELGADGLPEFEEPEEGPSKITEEQRQEGVRAGVIPTEPNSEPLILPHSQGCLIEMRSGRPTAAIRPNGLPRQTVSSGRRRTRGWRPF